MLNPPTKTIGKISFDLIVLIYLPILIATPFYTYHMAVSQDPKYKFPKATITQTACPYPQDIVFRYFMSMAASILALIFFIIFQWLDW